jgi:hypothetical protein
MLSEDKNKAEKEDMSITSDESPESKKMWLVEWNNTFGKSKTEEKYDYNEALSIFNARTAGGKDAILYEVERSAHDSSVVKKLPILNSVKARQRGRAEPDSKHGIQWGTKWKNKPSRLRYRIIILVTVIGLLIFVISLIDAL